MYAVDLGEALKIGNRLENPKENVADEIHRDGVSVGKTIALCTCET